MLQSLVAMSTTEAEYIAVDEATKEALWLKGLVKERSVEQGLQMHCGNQSAIYLAKYHVSYSKKAHRYAVATRIDCHSKCSWRKFTPRKMQLTC